MRVGIHFVGGTVRGPACVRDADAAFNIRGARFEICYFAYSFADVDLAILAENSTARAVVSSVLKPLQAGHQYGHSRLPA